MRAYPRRSTFARDLESPALRMGVTRVDKAAKRRVLATHAGCALPKRWRTRRRRTRIVCTLALVARTTRLHRVRRVTVTWHVPFAPRFAPAVLAACAREGNVGQ